MALNLCLRNTINLFKHLPKGNFNRLSVAVVPNHNYFQNSLQISKFSQNVSCSLNFLPLSPLVNVPKREFHLLKRIEPDVGTLFANRNGTVTPETNTKRSLVRFGFRGRRKTVKAVLRRFYRLDWGIWIHPRSGRHNKLWKKGNLRKKRARTHVFCNATQSFMLDKMVCQYWRKRKYYVDDPYEPYHTRPDFWITHRR